MKNLQLFLITLIAQKCCSEFVPLFQFFNPMSVPLAPMCPPTTYPASQAFHEPFSDNASAVENPKDNLKFLLPLLDMQIQCDRSLHVIQEQQEQQIYVLHGHDLYRLFVERQEKRLSWIAVLEGSVRHVESLGAQIISWQGSLLLVIALDEHLEIYQLDEEVLQQRAAAVKDPAKSHEPPPVRSISKNVFKFHNGNKEPDVNNNNEENVTNDCQDISKNNVNSKYNLRQRKPKD